MSCDFIKKLFKHNVFKNSFYLSFIQVLNYLVPFLILPYLISLFGVERYGVIAFSFAIIQISNVLTDFGFNLYATNKIALAKNDVTKINLLISSVFIIKLIIVIFICITIAVYSYFTTAYASYSLVILATIVPVFFQAFQPLWLFQGIEKMKYISVIMLISKFVYLILVFVFVSYLGMASVIFSYGVAQILATIISFYFINKTGFSFCFPKIKLIKEDFFESSKFFYSRLASMMYTSGSVFLLGVFSGPLAVSVYSIAEQFYKVILFAFMPLNQAIFPYMARTKNVALLFKIVLILFFVVCSISLLAYFLFPILLPFYLDAVSSIKEITSIFNIFLITLIFVIPSTFLGYPLFSALGRINLANHTVTFGAILFSLSIFLFYISGREINAATIAFTILFVEASVLFLRLGLALKVSRV